MFSISSGIALVQMLQDLWCIPLVQLKTVGYQAVTWMIDDSVHWLVCEEAS